MDDHNDVEHGALHGMLTGQFSRRRFLARAAALGLTIPVIGGLLAACAEDDDPDVGADPSPDTDDDEEPDVEDEDDEPDDEEDEEEPDDETPATDGDKVLTIGHNLDPTSLSTVETTSAAFQCISAQISEQLLIFDTEGTEVQPWLAESWEWVDDTTLELHLKEGVEFTNGEPFDAESAAFTVDIFTAAPRYAFFLPGDVYDRTEIIDDYTVQIHLQRAFAPFLGFLARSVTALPPVYFEELGSEAFGLEPIGTGPFVLSEWVRDSHLVLTRNDDYWRGPHPISQVVFRVIPEPVARLAAFETGEVDLAMYLTTEAINRLEGSDTTQAVVAAGLRKYATHFDTDSTEGALDDPRVRTALNHAVDKQALADTVFQGTADVLQGQWQVSSEPGFNPNISEFEYNPELARELIAEAGYADGFDLMLSYTAGNTPLEQELGEIVASYMEQVGVRVEQRYMEYGAFLNVRGEGTLGTHQWGLLLPPEPHFNYALFVQGSLYQWHYLGERYDELVDMGSKTTDPAEREEIYHECAQIMHDDPPMLYLVVPRDIYGVSSRVSGFEPRIDQVLWLFDVDIA